MTPSGRSAPTRLRFTLGILCATAAGMGVLLALLPASGHDQLWFLLMARRWLDGATLYGPQIFDSNPPAIVWLSAIAVVIGQGAHLPVTFVAKLLVVLAEAAAAALSFYFFRRARPRAEPFRPLALFFAFLLLFLVLPARDFGQRDQLLSFLILPYLLAAATSFHNWRCAPARLTAGALAAAGICLKPQYALIPIAVEICFLLRPVDGTASRFARLLRPEPVIILITGCLYLIAIRRFTPLYFSVALPILHETYWAVGHLSAWSLALEAIELCILAALSVVLFLRTTAHSPMVLLLLVAGFAAAGAYALQGTGWYYQQIPALALLGAALTLQLMDLAAKHPPTIPRWLPAATASLGLLALALTAHFMGYPFTPDRAFAIGTPDPTFFSSLPPGTPVAVLTTSVDATMMPVERYHLQWAQRTNNLWLLPAILRSETPATGHPRRHILLPVDLAALEALQHRWMVEDLTRWHPGLILVERCNDPAVHCQLLEDRHDNLLAWFLRDPVFAALWKSYRPLRSSGRFDAFVLAGPPN